MHSLFYSESNYLAHIPFLSISNEKSIRYAVYMLKRIQKRILYLIDRYIDRWIYAMHFIESLAPRKSSHILTSFVYEMNIKSQIYTDLNRVLEFVPIRMCY